MPVPGWYPDPDATPGRFRWWDGTGWTGRTTLDPRSGSESDSEAVARKARVGRRTRSVTVGVLVVLLLVSLVVTVAVVRSRDRGAVDERPSRTTGQTPFDDRSPSPSPSSSPSPSRVTRPSVDCRQVNPDQLGDPAADGRVHGGPLSFRALPSPWTSPASTGRFPFSRDSQVQTLRLPEKLPWQASAQVGVAAFDSYPGAHVAAEAMLNCLLVSDFYTSVDVTVSKSTGSDLKIDGHPASRLDTLLSFTHPDLTTKGSLVRIIVVDTSPVTYYFQAVPMERQDLIRTLDDTTRTLAAT